MATIAGSTLLTASVLADQRAEAQGVADMVMGIAGAAGGIVSGIVVGHGRICCAQCCRSGLDCRALCR
jgi:hypothetical protein